MQDLLKHIQTLSAVSKKSELALNSICKEITVSKGKDLQTIGHSCKTIYFVKKGLLRIYYFKDGNDITENFEFENAFVARAESLFSGKPSQKAIQAIEDTCLIAIDAKKLFQLFDSHPDLERLFRKIIEQSYVHTVNRLESLQFHTAEERYFDLMKKHPAILQRVPLKLIASYLGITAVSLSRIRATK